MKHQNKACKEKEHREKLIDTFINAVFLFDDKLVITFNYQNGSKTILLSDLEKSSSKTFSCS